ncbi:MAG: TonB-dependent receptor [Sphingomonadales bacterium]|nr:TonB-dependent receptor [Sphingomonadales bacterium]
MTSIKATRFSRFRRLSGASSLIMLAVAMPAAAQEAEPETDYDIVVTGTSIRGNTAPIGSALQVVDSADLRATGLSNTNEILKTIPQVANLGIEEGRGGGVQGADSNITQAKTINLRGLGVESTLVLLNGRRIVKNGSQAEFYDMSVFPALAIGRLEVIAEGASAIYGADAVGGVVNVITKRGRDATETVLRYGGADGFDEKKFSQTFGATWEGGDIFLAYDHYERGGLLGKERRQVTQDLRPYGGPDLRPAFGAPGTISISGVNYAIPDGNGVGLTPASFVAGTANREDINEYRSLLTDQNQDNFFGSIHHDITSDVTVFVEGYYSDRVYSGLGGSLNRGGATAVLAVPRQNPFFVHPTNPAAASVPVNYSFSKLLPPNVTGGERGGNIAGGFKYRMGNNWVMDASAALGRNHAHRFSDQVHTANLTSVLADTNPATAFNPFCNPEKFTCIGAANLEKLRGYSDFNFYSDMWNVSGSVSGPLFAIGGGDVSVAVGGEYRDEKLETVLKFKTTTVDPTTRTTVSGRQVAALYGELSVPLVSSLNARPGLEKLQLSAAVRYDDYSDFGGTTNPKFGIVYSPVVGVSLRGSYSTSFRAPSLADTDLAASLGYVPANFNDPLTNTVVRAIQILGAREGLGPERAKIWTAGVDLKPVSGLRASLTYYNINYSDRIATVGTAALLANPTVFGAFINRNPTAAELTTMMSSPYFTGATEAPSNFAIIIDGRVSNLGSTKQSGLDGDIDYSFDLGGGDARVGAQFTYLLKAEEALAKGLAFRDVLNQINYPIQFRGRAHAGWSKGGFSIDAFLNHVGGYDNTLRTPTEKVKSWNTLDVTIGYDLRDQGGLLCNTRIQLNVTNATNANPPFVMNTGAAVEGAYDGQNASVIGRFVAIEISKKW